MRYFAGVSTLLLGGLLLVPAVLLLNLGLRIFPVSWGIFDIRIAGVEMSDFDAGIVLGVTGLLLLVLSGLVLGKRQGRAE
jgi:hypothetical protein